MALEVRHYAGHVGGAAEFLGEPALEAVRRGFADLVIHQQHVLAPLHRLVARGKDLMRLAAGEEARFLEAYAHRLAEAGKSQGDAMLIAIIAQLDEAQHRRGVEPRHRAEIEHDIPDRFLDLSVDRAPAPFE